MSAATSTPGTEGSDFIEAEPAEPIGAQERPTRSDRARSAAYGARFTVVYVVLALVAGIGVGAFAVLMGRPAPAPQAKWSAWEPTGSDTAQARQIAARVSKSYRDGDGRQLAGAIATPPRIRSRDVVVPVSTIAVLPDASAGQAEEGDPDLIATDTSLQFTLCGFGQGCSISSSGLFAEQAALLRREALELALYTFKYVDGIETVSVFLPPPSTAPEERSSIFLKKSDVTPMLRKPLNMSIGPTTPTVGGILQTEKDLVDQVTLPRLYSFGVERAPDETAVLVYEPLVLDAGS